MTSISDSFSFRDQNVTFHIAMSSTAVPFTPSFACPATMSGKGSMGGFVNIRVSPATFVAARKPSIVTANPASIDHVIVTLALGPVAMWLDVTHLVDPRATTISYSFP